MKLEAEDRRTPDRALSLEWLETNGRGGFASGTVAGANTRRYHALLLVARKPPSERIVLVNHLEEWLDGGGARIPLSTNLYPGAVHPDGFRHCVAFSAEPWPTWKYDAADASVEREIFCPRGRDMVVIRWRRSGDQGPITLRVRPKLTGRDYHATHRENSALSSSATIMEGMVSWHPYADLPAVRAFHNGAYDHRPEWFRNVQLPIEQRRGLDHEEDWWSPGELVFELVPGGEATLVLTVEAIDRADAGALAEAERRRRHEAAAAAPKGDPLAGRLWYATEAYLSERGDGKTILAGYPWFTDWGRDTFISLPGLCLVTGRYEAARQVIEAFARHVSDGLIPNRFPDVGEEPEYNTIDASLWFIHAVDRYLHHAEDDACARKLVWPAVKQILDGYRAGARYGIRMDRDGLITGGGRGTQLTWMDAKVGDRAITSRAGKPVEIQALWVRALAVGEDWATRFGEPTYATACRGDRARAVKSFTDRFWYEEGGHLYDVIDGPEGNDPSLRPNQLYAVALTDGLVKKERAKRIVQVVQDHLLTPLGLRTLSPKDPRYCARYEGGVVDRDGSYHQGTVWPFLLGVFVTAYVKAYGKSAAVKRRARSFLAGLERHLDDACLGQVSEIFDGDAPHLPRGCPAQAWSVAEPLRALMEDLGVRRNTTVIKTRRRNSKPSGTQGC